MFHNFLYAAAQDLKEFCKEQPETITEIDALLLKIGRGRVDLENTLKENTAPFRDKIDNYKSMFDPIIREYIKAEKMFKDRLKQLTAAKAEAMQANVDEMRSRLKLEQAQRNEILKAAKLEELPDSVLGALVKEEEQAHNQLNEALAVQHEAGKSDNFTLRKRYVGEIYDIALVLDFLMKNPDLEEFTAIKKELERIITPLLSKGCEIAGARLVEKQTIAAKPRRYK